MGGNSTSCKIQCVVLVAGIVVLAAQTGKPSYVLLAFIPACLFLYLDAYYLALEFAFRKSYNAFVWKLHRNEVVLEDLFIVQPRSPSMRNSFFNRLRSTAIWPFYGAMVLMILLVWIFDWAKTFVGL